MKTVERVMSGSIRERPKYIKSPNELLERKVAKLERKLNKLKKRKR